MAYEIYGFDESKSKVPITGSAGITVEDGEIKHTNTVTEQTTYVGSSTKIARLKFDGHGHITGVDTVDVYPPTEVGIAGQVWTSDGTGVGDWKSADTTPTANSTNLVTSGGVKSAIDSVNNALSDKQDKVTISTSDPSGGKNGDIWLKYE